MNVRAHHWDALIKQMHDANLLTYYHLFDSLQFLSETHFLIERVWIQVQLLQGSLKSKKK